MSQQEDEEDDKLIWFPQLERSAVPRAPTPRELKQVAKYKLLRQEIHKGPLYTVLGGHVRVGKKRTVPKKTSDAFDNMPSFPKQHEMIKRRIPRLDTRPYGMMGIKSWMGFC